MRFCFDGAYYIFESPHSPDKPVSSQPFNTRRSRRTIITETKICDGIKHYGPRRDEPPRSLLRTANGILVFDFSDAFFFSVSVSLAVIPLRRASFKAAMKWAKERSSGCSKKPMIDLSQQGISSGLFSIRAGGLAIGKQIQWPTAGQYSLFLLRA